MTTESLTTESLTNNIIEKGDSILDISENLIQVNNLFDNKNLLDLKLIKNGVHDLLCSDGNIEDITSQLGEVFSCIKVFTKG